MKKYRAEFAFVFIGLGLLFFGFVWLNKSSTSATTTAYVQPAEQPTPSAMQPNVIIDLEKEPHYKVAVSWRYAAQRVTNLTRDEEAKNITAFLDESIGTGIPRPSSISIIKSPTGQMRVVLVPILQEDERLDEGLKQINTSKDTFALFRPDAKAIIVRSEPMSELWQGIVLLHEAKHALSYTRKPFESKNIQLLCYEERDTLEFQNRIVTKLGGEAYAKLLQAEIDRQREYLRSRNIALGTSFSDVPKYQTELETIFGPSKSSGERTLRNTQLWTHAIFKLIDSDYQGGNKQDLKARFIFGVYKLLGIQP